jgi:hypothetical protein
MPFCQSCGAEHSTDARFCPKCGQVVAGDDASQPIEPVPMTSTPPPPPQPLDIGGGNDAPMAPIDTPPSEPAASSPIPPLPPAPEPPTFGGPPTSPPPIATPNRALGVGKPQSINGLTTALTVLFILAAIASMIGAGLAASAVSDVNGIADGDRSAFGSLFVAEDANGKIGGASILFGVLALPILVLLVIWTFRAHRNLRAFGAEKPMLPTGMAIGSWFIPLFWYLGPFWCINDAYKGAAPDSGHNPQWRREPSAGIVLAWWLTFCISNVVYVIGSGVASSSIDGLRDIVDDPDRYASGWTIVGVSYVLGVAAAVLGVMAVRKVGARQEERLQAMAATP